jgi:hypothetical protein
MEEKDLEIGPGHRVTRQVCEKIAQNVTHRIT